MTDERWLTYSRGGEGRGGRPTGMSGGRWLTFIEVGERLGVSVEAVRAMARRGGWPKQRANGIGQVVRVQGPPDLFTTSGRAVVIPLATTGGATSGLPLVIRAEIEAAVEGIVGPLRDELA